MKRFGILDFGILDFGFIFPSPSGYKNTLLLKELELGMDERAFKRRTKQFALRVIRLVQALPGGPVTAVIGYQLLKAGTSVGANYRAACRGKSRKDVLAKLAIVEEEADESLYWMELLIEAEIISEERLQDLMQEGDEILSMIVASIKTLRKREKP